MAMTSSAGGAGRLLPPPRQGALLFAYGALLVLSILGTLQSFTDSSNSDDGSLYRQLLYLLAAGLTAYGLRLIFAPRRLLAIPPMICAMLAWCWLSVIWAAVPGVSLRRLVLTTVVIWSVFAGVRQLGVERTLLVMRCVLLAAVLVSYATVALFPDIGIHQVDQLGDKNVVGDWRGIVGHKNLAGAVCALCIAVFLFDAQRVPKWLRAAAVLLSAVFLYKTGSRTSLFDCAGAVLAGLLFTRYHARYRIIVIPLVLLLVLAAGTVTNIYADPLSALLSQKATLSGRLDIWDLSTRYMADHPILGSGFGSFWAAGPDSPAYVYGKGWVTEIPQGHNGFLDLAVSLGIPGLVLGLAAALVWPLYRLMTDRAANGPAGGLIFSLLVFCIVHNSTETSLFDRDAIGNVFLMTTIALLCILHDRGGRQAAGAVGEPGRSARKPTRFVFSADQAGTPS